MILFTAVSLLMSRESIMAWFTVVPKHAQVNFVRGAIPNQFTYAMVFNTCSILGDCGIVQLAHVRVIVNGLPTDLPLQNPLLDIYCSCI